MGAVRHRLESVVDEAHWDAAYKRLTASGVSWYQPLGGLSIKLVTALQLPANTSIIDVGGGASTFVDHLIAANFTDVTVVDLSNAALEFAKSRLGPGAPVEWIHADLLAWEPKRSYGLWHDRAVFHFLTDASDRTLYLDRLASATARPGYVVMATFAPDGPDRCSGLPVARYGAEDLTDLLAPIGLRVVASCREEHETPSGEMQPFTWVVARRS